MAQTQPLRILCLGDSLTEGYTLYGMEFSPYSRSMQNTLEMYFMGREEAGGWRGESKGVLIEGESVGGKDVQVVTDGMSGQLVLEGGEDGFLGRMEGRCAFDSF